MKKEINWLAIKEEYEQGKSQNLLAKKYGLSQPAISQYARDHHWLKPQLIVPQEVLISPISNQDIESNPAIISMARRILALHMMNNPDPKDFKMLMDSFSQINKIEMLAPAGDEEQTPHDLRRILAAATNEELDILRPILKSISERIQTEENNITPIRKMS